MEHYSPVILGSAPNYLVLASHRLTFWYRYLSDPHKCYFCSYSFWLEVSCFRNISKHEPWSFILEEQWQRFSFHSNCLRVLIHLKMEFITQYTPWGWPMKACFSLLHSFKNFISFLYTCVFVLLWFKELRLDNMFGPNAHALHLWHWRGKRIMEFEALWICMALSHLDLRHAWQLPRLFMQCWWTTSAKHKLVLCSV